jgi:hypothetical protein
MVTGNAARLPSMTGFRSAAKQILRVDGSELAQSRAALLHAGPDGDGGGDFVVVFVVDLGGNCPSR